MGGSNQSHPTSRHPVSAAKVNWTTGKTQTLKSLQTPILASSTPLHTLHRFYQFGPLKSTILSFPPFPTTAAWISILTSSSSDYCFASSVTSFFTLFSLQSFFQVVTRTQEQIWGYSLVYQKTYHRMSISGQDWVTGTKFILLPNKKFKLKIYK